MRILIVGDCVSVNCGFVESQGKVWHHNISDQHAITNLSHGGYSNQKIFIETIKELNKNKYDLVIVQWASPYRLILNLNDFYDNTLTLNINNPVTGDPFNQFYDIWMKNFLNSKTELTDLMTYAIALSVFLKSKKQDYIFIKGADTLLDDLQQDDWHNCREEFLNKVLFRDQYPDFKIDRVYKELKHQYQELVRTSGPQWLNLYGPGWRDQIIDEADDIHYYVDDHGEKHRCCPYPGIKSNQQQYQAVVEFAKKLGYQL